MSNIQARDLKQAAQLRKGEALAYERRELQLAKGKSKIACGMTRSDEKKA